MNPSFPAGGFRPFLRAAALLAVTAAFPAAAAHAAAEDDAVLERMRLGAASTLTLEADLTQTKTIPFMDVPLLSSGKICFDVTDRNAPRIFWEYTSPQRTGFSFGPQGPAMWTDEGDAGKGQEAFLQSMVREMLSWISFDRAELEKRYDIAVTGACSLHLVPRKKNPLFAEAAIRFSDDYRLVKSILFRGEGGDTTTIAFTNAARNKPLSEGCGR